MNTRILKITGHKIYYSTDNYITFESTNFPSLDEFKFSSHKEIYWEVSIEKFNPETKSIELTIIDYYSNEKGEFQKQTRQNSELVSATFKNIVWSKLEPLFMFYRKSAFSQILSKEQQRFNWARNVAKPSKENNPNEPTSEMFNYTVPRKERIPIATSIYFKNATFFDGGVKFNIKVSNISQKVSIEIPNPEIKKEFDHIKYYFPKVFGSKKFEVTGTIVLNSGDIEFENINSHTD